MKYRELIFLSSRLARGARSLAAGRLLKLSLLGIALSVSVVLLALSIILGFKSEVADLAYRQTGHLSLYHYGSLWSGTNAFIKVSDEVKQYIESQQEVKSIQAIVQQMAMLKTEDDFIGIPLYGVEPGYPIEPKGLKVGKPKVYQFSYSDSLGNPIVLPHVLAEKMALNLGDKLRLYFMVEGKIKVRSFYLADTYPTAGLDKMPALCSVSALHRLLGIEADMYSRIIVQTNHTSDFAPLAEDLSLRFSTQDKVAMPNYAMSTAEELLPDLFAWLSLLDSNVVFLVVVIVLISIFTMITGVIILVLDKTRHIGVIKALGGDDRLLQKTFALIAFRLMAWGLFWGNVIALVLLVIQYYFAPLRLDPRDYFIDRVPVLLEPMIFVWVNILSLLVLAFAVLFPLRTINSIRPSLILRFE